MKQGRSPNEIDEMDIVWYLELASYFVEKEDDVVPIDQIRGM
ncbi:hypothetical protein OS242_10605 [Tumebacillus sp. DT12]|uniref:Uncharacterized protein n=1 Tax=Tumebacillus lacus TaxID=2995335 RepID=A0ABT3X373_9BACL|nr:hypothetical protein [Tumebacillus lacus]MCX7570413.1 hypothetical protein [Tumebacillus lacus]